VDIGTIAGPTGNNPAPCPEPALLKAACNDVAIRGSYASLMPMPTSWIYDHTSFTRGASVITQPRHYPPRVVGRQEQMYSVYAIESGKALNYCFKTAEALLIYELWLRASLNLDWWRFQLIGGVQKVSHWVDCSILESDKDQRFG
jgi:hypothetical protein